MRALFQVCWFLFHLSNYHIWVTSQHILVDLILRSLIDDCPKHWLLLNSLKKILIDLPLEESRKGSSKHPWLLKLLTTKSFDLKVFLKSKELQIFKSLWRLKMSKVNSNDLDLFILLIQLFDQLMLEMSIEWRIDSNLT